MVKEDSECSWLDKAQIIENVADFKKKIENRTTNRAMVVSSHAFLEEVIATLKVPKNFRKL